MKKIISWVSIAVLSFGIVSIATLAQAQDSTTTSGGTSNTTPLLGNEHDYSVTVKASGMLVVNAKIVLTNNTDQPKSDFSFPGVSGIKGNPTGYQQIKGRHCDHVDYTANKCLSYGDPDYSANSYSDGYDEANKYQTLNVKVGADKLSFTLPTPIESSKATAVVLSYYLSGQVTDGIFGSKKFSFDSLGDNDLIKNVSVSVSTDADLYTKSNRSKVTAPSTGFASLEATGSSAISSKALDSAVSSIGYYGDWMDKTGKDIVPGENFSVSGTYSTNWIGLYYQTVLIFLAIIILIILGIWWLARKSRARSIAQSTQASPASAAPTSTSPVNLSFHEAATFRNFLISFFVAGGAILLVVGGSYLISLIPAVANFDTIGLIIDLAALLLGVVLFGAVIAWPIYQGVRKGINLAAVTVISYVAAIIVAILITIIVIAVLPDSNSSDSTPISSDVDF